MLSRHAEDLYWIGRYIERAEDTARMLDVTYHGLLESPPAEVPAAWRELLEVLYLEEAFPTDRAISGTDVTELLVLDESNPGSIVAAVGRARQNARGVRDRISTELWEAINTFYLELAGRDLRAELHHQPYAVYRMIKNRCQTLAGVGSESMPRDEGYGFLVLGRMLERAEMTCRLLAVRYARLGRVRELAFHQWVAVLKSVSAFEAYLKEHRAALDPIRVLEFLLLSQDFPRSVLFCLRFTEQQLARLEQPSPRSTVPRLLGRARAKLEYCDVEEVLSSGLDQFLDDLQHDIWSVAEAIDHHFFRVGADLALHSYESS